MPSETERFLNAALQALIQEREDLHGLQGGAIRASSGVRHGEVPQGRTSDVSQLDESLRNEEANRLLAARESLGAAEDQDSGDPFRDLLREMIVRSQMERRAESGTRGRRGDGGRRGSWHERPLRRRMLFSDLAQERGR